MTAALTTSQENANSVALLGGHSSQPGGSRKNVEKISTI